MPVTSEKLEVTFRSISQLDASLCWVRPPPTLLFFFLGGEKRLMLIKCSRSAL